mmetsp:Transcript_9337/g.26669  ORF Transcript_9337/g.26669 Transcript_9337/m.26669 type:complete len:412 (-) Transcript_9337:134-1369(-)
MTMMKFDLLDLRETKKPDENAQKVNKVLHQKPYSIVYHHAFWFIMFTFAMPFVGMGVLIKGILELCLFSIRADVKISPKENGNNQDEYDELAVIITGCDSGIGKEVALHLISEKFTVFCGCLNEESMKQFRLEERAKPLLLDVTKQSQVDEAVEVVTQWLEDPECKKNNKKRRLHALVNNAGVGTLGLFDWITVDDYKFCMEVNCFGMIRMCKSFLPIFKNQSLKLKYKDAQIQNVVSMAGMHPTAGGVAPAYQVSKNAAYSFSDSLRYEMTPLGIHVTTCCPTFHDTPLVDGVAVENSKKAVWDKLSPKTQKEYGFAYFDRWARLVELKMTSIKWNLDVVVDEIVKCVQSRHPPAELLVGMDSTLMYAPIRLMSMWLRHLVISGCEPKEVPVMLQDRKEEAEGASPDEMK